MRKLVRLRRIGWTNKLENWKGYKWEAVSIWVVKMKVADLPVSYYVFLGRKGGP